MDVSGQSLTLTATDLELEMVSYTAEIDNMGEDGKITVPAKETCSIFVKACLKDSILTFESEW